MDKDTIAMARGNYGYGRWDAPYWFIGPEQGMASPNNNLDLRVEKWRELGSCELNDCREFHRRIGEMQWHFKEPTVNLQQTWRPLMLLLMSFLNRPIDNDSLRNSGLRRNYHLRAYQRDRWGAVDEKAAETCVIELSGLAAPSASESEDTRPYRAERIKVICKKMRAHQPKLVVMYGRGEETDAWRALGRCVSGREFPLDGTAPCNMPKTSVLLNRPTILVCTPHPSKPPKDGKQSLKVNEYWTRLGKKLRDLST